MNIDQVSGVQRGCNSVAEFLVVLHYIYHIGMSRHKNNIKTVEIPKKLWSKQFPDVKGSWTDNFLLWSKDGQSTGCSSSQHKSAECHNTWTWSDLIIFIIRSNPLPRGWFGFILGKIFLGVREKLSDDQRQGFHKIILKSPESSQFLVSLEGCLSVCASPALPRSMYYEAEPCFQLMSNMNDFFRTN